MPWRIIYFEEHKTRSEAMKREVFQKWNWTRGNKEDEVLRQLHSPKANVLTDFWVRIPGSPPNV